MGLYGIVVVKFVVVKVGRHPSPTSSPPQKKRIIIYIEVSVFYPKSEHRVNIYPLGLKLAPRGEFKILTYLPHSSQSYMYCLLFQTHD
jgi:hypothetical protein